MDELDVTAARESKLSIATAYLMHILRVLGIHSGDVAYQTIYCFVERKVDSET